MRTEGPKGFAEPYSLPDTGSDVTVVQRDLSDLVSLRATPVRYTFQPLAVRLQGIPELPEWR